ncbi:hypothetical protein RBU49_15975 [Clostridium sp. MB40-C1]|uniref:hypothetical protein n=1 Tax=Clostridium sp. MB40-C1 TaxID=3070996 RepID=UPI0027DFDF5F|nr:hypothetical protein [Clostridium sp. MB40-C1]WMJ80281.1 hypothetical protein RBU49_15975 [Clostridium sp. MB40-C1]
MGNYTSQPQEIKGNTISIPHLHSNEEAKLIQYGNMVDGYTAKIPTLYSMAQGYERSQKFKNYFEDNVFK